MFVYIWVQTDWHSDGIPETFFEKVGFEKNSVDMKNKTIQNYYSACKIEHVSVSVLKDSKMDLLELEYNHLRNKFVWIYMYMMGETSEFPNFSNLKTCSMPTEIINFKFEWSIIIRSTGNKSEKPSISA